MPSNSMFSLNSIEMARRYVQTSAAPTFALFYEENNYIHAIELPVCMPVLLLVFRESRASKTNGQQIILKRKYFSKALKRALKPYNGATRVLCHADALKSVKTYLSASHGIKSPNNGHVLEYLYSLHVGGVWDSGDATPYYVRGDVVKPNGDHVQCKATNGSITESSTLTAIKYMHEGL